MRAVLLGIATVTSRVGLRASRDRDVDIADVRGLAIGGTTYGSAITLAAARAALEEILTEEGYARTEALGARLADGIAGIIARRGLDWQALRYGPRSGFCLSPELPRNLDEALPSLDQPFTDARRVFMANRGVWEAIATAGPQTSFAHDEAEVDRYLEVAEAFVDEIVAR